MIIIVMNNYNFANSDDGDVSCDDNDEKESIITTIITTVKWVIIRDGQYLVSGISKYKYKILGLTNRLRYRKTYF